ncbi:MAG: hypothetical protein ABUL72_07065, partial [Armatimonadota bacterium]
MTINRDTTKPGGYTGTYAFSGKAIIAANQTFTATFYASPALAGAIVATATGSVDGSGNSLQLGSVSLASKITKVTVMPTSGLTVTSPATQLTFSATDASNNVVAVAPGAAFWSVVANPSVASLTKDGVLTPKTAGTVQVVVKVDTVTSATASVTITADSQVSGTTFKVIWPAMSRSGELGAPSSALSMEMLIVGGSPIGADVSYITNRDQTSAASYTATYTIASALSTSKAKTFRATFFGVTGATGAAVAVANGSVTIDPVTKTITLGSIIIDSKVTSVQVVQPPRVAVGSGAVQLTASAKDKDGNVIAVSPRTTFWTQVSGASFGTVSQDGMITPVSPGTVQVNARVGTVTSPTADVAVDSSTTQSNAYINISWQVLGRSNELPGYSSGQSVSITFPHASLSGTAITMTVNRDLNNGGAYVGKYFLPEPIQMPVTTQYTATFYASPDLQGQVVATASGSVFVTASSGQ